MLKKNEKMLARHSNIISIQVNLVAFEEEMEAIAGHNFNMISRI